MWKLRKKWSEFINNSSAKFKTESFESKWFCNNCLGPIEEGVVRYKCEECSESYDLCKNCVFSTNSHLQEHWKIDNKPHTFSEENSSQYSLSKCRDKVLDEKSSIQKGIYEIFLLYKTRNFIGIINEPKFHQYIARSSKANELQPLDEDLQSNNNNNVIIDTEEDEILRKEENYFYEWYTYQDVLYYSLLLMRSLHSFVVEETKQGIYNKVISYFTSSPKKMIGICGKNTLQWVISDFASIFLGVVSVPIQTNSQIERQLFIINQTEMIGMIIDSTEQTLISHILNQANSDDHQSKSTIKFIVIITSPNELLHISITTPHDKAKLLEELGITDVIIDEYNNMSKNGIMIFTLEELIGNEQKRIHDIFNNQLMPNYNHPPFSNKTAHISPELQQWVIVNTEKMLPSVSSDQDLYSITYTSGSTGQPKGVVQTNYLLKRKMKENYGFFSPEVTFSYCTFAHSMDRNALIFIFSTGGRVGLYSRNFDHIFQAIEVVAPTIFASTPRIYNVLYAEYLKLWESSDKSKIPQSEWKTVKSQIANRLYQSMGGRVRVLTTGGAPTSHEVMEFIKLCFNSSMIFNGYGLTEVGGIAADGRVKRSEIDVKLISVSELGFTTEDKPHPRGEICVRSLDFTGYYKDSDATQSALTSDGYFKTGDIGVIDENGMVKVIDRKKSIFKLAAGEYVCPEQLEIVYQDLPIISQIFINGFSDKEYILAVVVPDRNVLLSEFSSLINDDELNEDSFYSSLISREEVNSYILEQLYLCAVSKKLQPYEYIRGIYIEAEIFTFDNNKLTASLKVARNFCRSYYHDIFSSLYNDIQSARSVETRLRHFLCSRSRNDDNEDNRVVGVRDSLSAVQLSEMIKRQYRVTISPSALLKTNLQDMSITISNTLNHIDNRSTESSSFHHHNNNNNNNDININNEDYNNNIIINQQNEKRMIDRKSSFEADIVLPVEIVLPEKYESLKFNDGNSIAINVQLEDMKEILLTGATGFVGSMLLHDLILNTSAKIYCLVRPSPSFTTREKLRNSLLDTFNSSRNMQNEEIEDILQSRIIIIEGDLEKKQLGIKNEVWNHLCSHLDSIYHCGAVVNTILPYERLRSANVDATIEVLKMISDAENRFKPQPIVLHYISTVGVWGKHLPFGNEKQPLNSMYVEHSVGYNQSKFVSDILIQQARDRGFYCSIFRLGRIFSDTHSGYSNMSDFFILLVCGILQLGFAPIMNEKVRFNLLAVNVASSSILRLSFDAASFCHAIHVVHPKHSVDFEDVLEAIQQVFPGRVNRIEYSLWYEKLIAIQSIEENVLYTLKSLFSPYAFPQSPTLSCDYFTSLVERNNISIPPVTLPHLLICLEYLKLKLFC